ncbi:MAG: ABC transporter permease [Betaproteobacteria bacterium RBG_16_64_18]|nr:MAG: ABC transporter permease [Betaproteobacteria bacterium RBG_16_64_18]OGA42178.1 MAG: ABC transporter permease [Betaproteobacteria bacterium RIFCSPLOWO2_12_FULL_65_110]
MLSQTLQYLFSGLTNGAIYALSALGFSLIYNASGVINFAQGEFIMLGGVAAVLLTSAGVPLPLAILLAVLMVAVVGLLLEKFAIEPAGDADVVSLIIITIGASIFLQGVAQVVFGKGQRALAPFTGDAPIVIAGASLLPQSLWMIGTGAVIVLVLAWFFGRTRLGKAMLATAHNRLAARLVGINTRHVLALSFVISAALGAIAGVVSAPITLTSYDVGIMVGLKGFVAATLGGLGSGVGAVAGGLILGLTEALAAGYISSAYKDAVPFVLIILILFFMPRGLFGARVTERV